MTTIVTRAGKGSPLTNTEMDTNLTNLNTYKCETANNLSDLTNTATARTNLGLAIGTNVQGYDADIATVAATQAEMEAGTETALRSMSPLRVKQAVNATTASGIANTGGWAVTPSGTTLYLAYNGTNIGKLDSSGNLTVIGNMTAYGTV